MLKVYLWCLCAACTLFISGCGESREPGEQAVAKVGATIQTPEATDNETTLAGTETQANDQTGETTANNDSLAAEEEPGPFIDISELLVPAPASLGSPVSLSSAVSLATAIVADRQLVFSLDGSGSISSEDWNLQKQGIVAALADRISFPVDGSIAIAVSQWSAGVSRTEVPLIAITSQTDIDTVSAQIAAITQIGGSTNPGDGVRAATDILVATGDPAAEWLICQSTDGVLNSGESLDSSVQYASTSGIDRYSLLAIEDPGFFDRNSANSFYGPQVFGGGSVNVARNTAEFASLLIGTCLNPPLEVIAMEINQAVQSWDLSVPLITNKLGVLRAFIQTNGDFDVVTSGLLFGTREDGTALPMSPLAAVNPGGTVVAIKDAVSSRADRDATLNFVLPRSWMQSGNTVRLELPGGELCSESAPPENTCEIDITTTTTADLDYRPIALAYTEGSTVRMPSTADLNEQALRTWTQFPIGEINIDDGVFTEVFPSAPTASDALGRLGDMRSDECALGTCNENAYWYGVMSGSQGGGVAFLPGNVGVGFTGNVEGKNEEGYARNRGPHETAHSLGRPHAVDGSLGLVDKTLFFFGGRKQGYCGEKGSKDAEDFPFINDVNGQTVPTLGPIGDPETEIWGFDYRFYSGKKSLAISNPTETLPLLSYGNGGECKLASSGQFRWISSHTYQQLIDAIGIDPAQVTSNNATAGSDWNALFISGAINFSDQTVDFRNSRLLPSGRVNFDSTGEFSLDVFDRAGGLITVVALNPTEMDADAPEDGGPRGYFNVPVLLPATAIGRVDIRLESIVLGSLIASDSAPTVDITLPLTGTEIRDEQVDIAWTGGDADGDTVTYSVFYSPNGVDWRGLVHNTQANSITVPKSQLVSSDDGKLVVIASDGINSARSELDLIVIGNNAPTISIVSPNTNELFSGVQTIFGDAIVIDREDGALSGTSVTWSSDIDGPIGSGNELSILASDLSEGAHVLTVEATDSGGVLASNQVVIEVVRIARPPAEFCEIVNFQEFRLTGLDRQIQETESFPVAIPDGSYQIVLESSDELHGNPGQPDQLFEQWFLEGLDENGNVVLVTLPSDDVPVDSPMNSTSVGDYQVANVTSVRGKHAFVTNRYNSVVPVRAIFVTPTCVIP